MKITFSFLLTFIVFQFCFAQSRHICHLNSLESSSETFEIPFDLALDDYSDSKEAKRYIEKLLKLMDLPMGYKVYECAEKCKNKNNAYATMDINGNRYIVYDNTWLESLDSDSTKIESLTILAHEIGHHLSAHTLSLNYKNHENAFKYCNKKSPHFNQKICNERYMADYDRYLRKSREQELEADRIAGFVMCLYGVDSTQVFNSYRKITFEYNDSNSTHPSLKKRLSAINEGFKLGLRKKRNKNFKPDIHEIKGGIIDFKVTKSDEMERRRLISMIDGVISIEVLDYVANSINHRMSRGGCPANDKNISIKLIEYHNKKDSPVEWERENEYFITYCRKLSFVHEESINFTFYPAFHIKENVLKILLFDEKGCQVVYSSRFNEEEISLKEIKSIFIELVKNGLNKKIEAHNESQKK